MFMVSCLWFYTLLNNLDSKLSQDMILLKERKRDSSHGISNIIYHELSKQIMFQYGNNLVKCNLLNDIIWSIHLWDSTNYVIRSRADSG